MEPKRYTGFVIGYDEKHGGEKVWKVRVKDRGDSHDGQKFVVASVRGRIELARGLNVHFAIGTVDDRSGTKVLRAVDVCLEVPEQNQTTNVNRSGG